MAKSSFKYLGGIYPPFKLFRGITMEKKCIAGIIVVLVVVIAAFGAYLLLTDDSKADNDTYYFFIQTEEGYDSEGLPYDSATMQKGFWVKAHGDNASDALQNVCKDKKWSIVIGEMPGEAGGDSMDSLFGLAMTDVEGIYHYWAMYVWDNDLDAFGFSKLTLEKVIASDGPQYISLIYKEYITGTDVPPTVTPDDIPEDVL